MNYESMIEIRNLTQKFNGWAYVDISALSIPKGFSIALVGENGAGKSTFIKNLSGIYNGYTGDIDFFNGEKNQNIIRNNIGYVGTNNNFLPSWRIDTIADVCSIAYDNFSKEKFKSLCVDFGIEDTKKKFGSLSDGMKMKVSLASAFARDCKLLLLDEPASPLDPLMRDVLCSKIQEYIDSENEERSVLFSTHNISDMAHITDYVIILSSGKVVEAGFVEELKEKYVYISGNNVDDIIAEKYILNYNTNQYGYEGLCLSEHLDKFDKKNITCETPTLSQICVSLIDRAYHPLTQK